ncbi:glycine zipper 2TM domain-containing protein [Serratia rhizosphaerae]|uniref:Glycine zipper 2TM domain-containing protein n=1 Tax=Serratia rhizosphaerae TaxID=2597702 RepID=A0ABX6GT91_9GAMM|nr:MULTISPECIES: glycine zipper 2TM domain-containing protein [Serratia]MBU3892375.1 glycine zipper 2TM domain-containing protein [Serratia rubidaea]AVJ17695.1 osmotically-inducible lipoprotein B [Serratia sp. MYb239]MEB6337443.1 glycine zipper 2TM domain-containing protein [Serratia rhizosphaerae]QHA89504.1 glycine zipper 2TM domain-containing protein [Serratia rhizosphaerae]QNK30465.1 glycine zipper 2TM domain-containing protein [Serratia sp. JUb9]
MNIKRAAGVAVLILSTLSVTACGHMSNRDRNTAVGAGVGALGGAVLTDGSTLGTLGGAALGGIIGHQTSR